MPKEITKDKVKTWLEDPCTKFFCEWMTKNHSDLKLDASSRAYNSLELDKKTLQILAIARGVESIVTSLEEMIEQIKEEEEILNLPIEKRPEIQDNIKEMIEFVYGVRNE